MRRCLQLLLNMTKHIMLKVNLMDYKPLLLLICLFGQTPSLLREYFQRCVVIFLLLIVPQSAVYSSLLALQPYYEFVQGEKIANPFYVPTFNWHTLDTYFLETAFTIRSYKLIFSFFCWKHSSNTVVSLFHQMVEKEWLKKSLSFLVLDYYYSDH